MRPIACIYSPELQKYRSRMNSSVLASILNVFTAVFAVVQLCVTSQLFDFIVVHKMYYTVPDQRVLVDSEIRYWFYGAALGALVLSMTVSLIAQSPQAAQSFVERHSFACSVVHGLLLLSSAIVCTFCTVLAVLQSMEVGKYAYDAQPKAFQLASHWYYTRLRISIVLYGTMALVQATTLCLLYLGVQCRYRSFAQLSSKNLY